MKTWGKWKWILAFLAVGLMANADAGEEGSSGAVKVWSKSRVKAVSGPDAVRQKIGAVVDDVCACKDMACAKALGDRLRSLTKDLEKAGLDLKNDPGLAAMKQRALECFGKLAK